MPISEHKKDSIKVVGGNGLHFIAGCISYSSDLPYISFWRRIEIEVMAWFRYRGARFLSRSKK